MYLSEAGFQQTIPYHRPEFLRLIHPLVMEYLQPRGYVRANQTASASTLHQDSKQHTNAEADPNCAIWMLLHCIVSGLCSSYHPPAKTLVNFLAIRQCRFQTFAGFGHFMVGNFGCRFYQSMSVFNQCLSVMSQSAG